MLSSPFAIRVQRFYGFLLVLLLVGGPASAESSALARIKRDGVIKVGVRHSAAPFSYFDPSGEAKGFSWALCDAVIKSMEAEMGRKIERKVIPVDLKQSFDMLADGSIDLQCGSTTHTEEREKSAAFSNTFFVAGLRVAYRAGDAKHADGRHFGRVIVLKNSTAATVAQKRLNGARDAEFVTSFNTVENYEEGVKKLKAQEADTFFADAVLMPYDPAIALQEKSVTVEPYALMVNKSDTQLLQSLNSHLAKVLTSQGPALADQNGLKGKVDHMTRDAWRRPSSAIATSLY